MDYSKLLDSIEESPLEHVVVTRQMMIDLLTLATSNERSISSDVVDELCETFENRIVGDEDSLIDFSSAKFELNYNEITVVDIDFYKSDFSQLLRTLLHHNLVVRE